MTKEYTLKECLEMKGEKELKNFYIRILKEQGFEVPKSKDITKEKIIDQLSEMLIAGFTNYLGIANINDLEKMIKKQDIRAGVELNFVYCLKKGKEKNYIIPKELMALYQELNIKNSEISTKRFTNIIASYALINGTLRKDFVNEIVKKHSINIDNETINEKMKEIGFALNKDNYYVHTLNGKKSKKEVEAKIKKIIEAKEKLTSKLLDENELMEYHYILYKITSELENILKIDEIKANEFMAIIMSFPKSTEDIMNLIEEQIKIDDDTQMALGDFLDSALEEVRYWSLNGRNMIEYREENILKDYLLSSKPQDRSLKTCLKSLKKETYNELMNDYFDACKKCDINDLASEIEERYQEELFLQDQIYYKNIKKCHNKELKEISEIIDDIESGCIYIYEENNKIKTFMPIEIQNIINHTNINDLFDSESFLNNYFNFNDIFDDEEDEEN